MTTTYNQDFTTLLNCVMVGVGEETGQLVKDYVDQALAADGVDIAQITASLQQLNDLITANGTADGVTAQSLLASLTGLSDRITTLEGSTAVANLTALVNAVQAALTQETADRIAAGDATAQQLATMQASIDNLSQQVSTVVNGGGGGEACDCAAITATLAEHSTALANLVGVDSQQAAQIAALQQSVESLTVSVSGLAAIEAAATQAAAAANAANQAAGAAANAAATAQSEVDALEGVVATLSADAAATKTLIENFHTEVQNVSCVAVVQNFRTAARGKAFGLTTNLGGGNN